MKISKTDLKILLALYSGNDSVGEIAHVLEMSIPRISSASSHLAQSGFLAKDGRGPSMRLKFSDNVFMHNLKQLFSMNFQFEKIFTGSGLIFLTTLMVPEMSTFGGSETRIGLSRDNIRRLSGLSFRTIDRVKKQLISAAVIFERKGRYRISRAQKELHEFLDNYVRYHTGNIINKITTANKVFHYGVVQKFVAGGEIILASPDELTSTNELEISSTAITAMSQDRIQFLSNQYFYHFSIGQRELMKEDYVIDTLLLGTTSAHNIAYSMLYLQYIFKNIDRDYLIEMSTIFNIINIIESILQYLDRFPDVGNDLPKDFPKVDEFRELCKLYGVALHEQ